MNNRRRLLIALGASALVAPFVSFAQPQGKVWRVGYLSPQRRGTVQPLRDAFIQALHEFGYVQGTNLVVDVRYAENELTRLPELAAELVALRPDVIVATTTFAIRAAQQTTTSIPIVMCPATDPVGSGFVANLARPGGNITGLANMSVDTSSKVFQILHTFVPSIKRFAVLISSNSTHVAQVSEVQRYAEAARLVLIPVRATIPSELEGAFAAMLKERCGAVIVLADPLFVDQRQHIAELCAQAKLPAVYQFREHVEAGGLVSYGPKFIAMFKRAAFYVDKILKGVKPGDLPIEQPTVFEMYINRKTAKALGLTIPKELLLRADKVIE